MDNHYLNLVLSSVMMGGKKNEKVDEKRREKGEK